MEATDIDILEQTIQTYGESLTKDDQKRLEASLLQFSEGKTLGEILHVTPTLIHFMYEQARKLFQAGQYLQAEKFFKTIGELDPSLNEVLFALAATLHKQKKYQEAIAYYLQYVFLDPENPMPFLHLYDCWKELRQKASSLWPLEEAIVRIKKQPHFSKHLLAKAELERDHLIKSLEQIDIIS